MGTPPSVFLTELTPELQKFWDDDFNLEMSVRMLSLKQQNRVHLTRDRHLKHKRLLNYLFVQYVFNCALRDGTMKEPVLFTYTKLGKPQFPGIEFNMSSSNVVLSIAVDHYQNPIGIDLSHEEQRIQPENIVEQFRQVMSESEANQIEAISGTWDRYLKFNHLWTLKEAYSKYLALGLNMDLASCSFSMQSLTDGILQPALFPPLRGSISSENEVVPLTLQWVSQRLENESQLCFSCVVKSPAKEDKLPVMMSVVYDREITATVAANAFYVDIFVVVHNHMSE